MLSLCFILFTMSRIRGFNYKTAKQKKAEKFLGSMLKISFKAGAAITKGIAKSGNNVENIQTEGVASSPKGCGVGLIAFIITIVITFIYINGKNFNFLVGLFLLLFIPGMVALLVTIIAMVIIGKRDNSEENVEPLQEEQREKVDEIVQFMLKDNNIEDIKDVLGDEEVERIVLENSFDKIVECFLEDDLLSEKEENRLIGFIKYFKLSQEDLNKNKSYEKVILASILRSITEGIIPEKIRVVEGAIPFNLNKNEKMIWIFQDTDYYEDTIKHTYQGNSNGISMKVAKGVYYRMGNFKGQTIETKILKYVGRGFLGFTDKHIYFYSYDKSFRIPYSKIVTILPYEAGVRIQKEGVTAKPQIFNNINGWFVYNLIMNLSKW